MSTNPFLTAIWKDLLLVTYTVPHDLLTKRLAPGLELDTLDGSAFVSLVAFDFLETQVKGVKWPGFVNFPEINLRFYVRETQTGRRGVMFVKELVPSALVAWIARSIYNEPYASTQMTSERSVNQDEDTITLNHRFDWKNTPQSLTVKSRRTPHLPAADTYEHFFKEHQWGFGLSRGGDPLVYEVKHPHWEVHAVLDLSMNIDFGHLYGPEFSFLNDEEPFSTVHAAGSEISVSPHSAR